jgi:two-component system sensor histidine kinase KdpD
VASPVVANLTRQLVAALAPAAVGVGLTTALIAWLRSRVAIPNAEMLYIIAVLGIATLFGRRAAVAAAALAFLASNFFFVDPLFTFHVTDPREWLALGVLLLTAVVTGQLAASLRDRARLAEAREREVTALYELATQAEVLRQADQVKSALLSSVSHDLRTPLASIKASVTTLLDDRAVLDPSARRELLTAVDEETDRLTRFVARLLDLSRLEGGAVEPRRDWHALGDVLSGVAERLDPDGVRIVLESAQELPSAFFDYVLVDQILMNLVENALKYAPSGSTVDIAASASDGALTIQVADRGPGVPAEERERIFERFYRSAPPAGDTSGAGMGLAIARGLARAMGGDVTYRPREGGGSVFQLAVPASLEETAAVH